jgi:hypothetical protein
MQEGIAYVYPDERKGKLSPHGRKVHYVGPAAGYKDSYIVVDAETRRESIRKDVHWLDRPKLEQYLTDLERGKVPVGG